MIGPNHHDHPIDHSHDQASYPNPNSPVDLGNDHSDETSVPGLGRKSCVLVIHGQRTAHWLVEKGSFVPFQQDLTRERNPQSFSATALLWVRIPHALGDFRLKLSLWISFHRRYDRDPNPTMGPGHLLEQQDIVLSVVCFGFDCSLLCFQRYMEVWN